MRSRYTCVVPCALIAASILFLPHRAEAQFERRTRIIPGLSKPYDHGMRGSSLHPVESFKPGDMNSPGYNREMPKDTIEEAIKDPDLRPLFDKRQEFRSRLKNDPDFRRKITEDATYRENFLNYMKNNKTD